MEDHLYRLRDEFQQRCAQIISSLHQCLRSTIIPRLPGQHHDHVSHVNAFLGHQQTSSPLHIKQKDNIHNIKGISKEEIGRATWTFLHTLCAQYPEHPTRRQQQDARSLIDILTRMYPCGECAQHFRQVVKDNPPRLSSRHDFSQWMCQVHNTVNRSLKKPVFNCAFIESRWSGIDCEEKDACSLNVGAVSRRRRS